METLEALGHQIQSVHDLQSVVKTMKGLAAVNIRQYEEAVEALRDYSRSLELGMQVLMRSVPDPSTLVPSQPPGRRLVVVLGSDQGMCGQFNSRIASFVHEKLGEVPADQQASIFAVGIRAAAELEAFEHEIADIAPLPGSVSEINRRVQELVLQLDRAREEHQVGHVWLFHHRPLGGASYEAHFVQVIPLDIAWLRSLRDRAWPGHSLPTYSMERGALVASLVRQHLFITLYRGLAESLAAENAARLASMQAAEKNVEERLDDLTDRYHQRRQNAITEELLDVTAGFEVLRRNDSG